MAAAMYRQETPEASNEVFYYLNTHEVEGYIITCNNWNKSEWKESDGYNYFTEEYGEVELYWDEDSNGFYVPKDYLYITDDLIAFMNQQHASFVKKPRWILRETSRGYLIRGSIGEHSEKRPITGSEYGEIIRFKVDAGSDELRCACWNDHSEGWIVRRQDYKVAQEWVRLANN